MSFHIAHASPHITSDMVAYYFDRVIGVVQSVHEFEHHNAFGFHKVFDIVYYQIHDGRLFHLLDEIDMNGFAKVYYSFNNKTYFWIVTRNE